MSGGRFWSRAVLTQLEIGCRVEPGFARSVQDVRAPVGSRAISQNRTGGEAWDLDADNYVDASMGWDGVPSVRSGSGYSCSSE